MFRKSFLFLLFAIIAFWFTSFELTSTGAQAGTPGDPVRGGTGDWWADVVIGQPNFGQITPNQVVGNKLFNPGGVYVDRSTIPNRLYVYDAGNSRILGFSSLGACMAGSNMGQSCTSISDCPGSSCQLNSTKSADLILGQPSSDISACNGDSGFQHYPNLPAPNAGSLCGLRPESVSILEGGSVATMASDSQGNLYHPDYFNNRVLRYNNPFGGDSTADYVWGQLDFTHAACNQGRSYGQPDNKSLCLAAPPQVGSLKAGVAVDSAGNLWVTDTQNNRVLRFPYSAALGVPVPEADLVLGQVNFSTAISGSGLSQMKNPGSVRVDASGNVYVLDGLDGWGTHGRLLVFNPPLSNGMAASQVFSGLGEPNGLELDPSGKLWINNGEQNKVLYLTNGQLQQVANTIVPVHGGLGIDRDTNILLTGWNSQEVQIYTPPNYSWIQTFLLADEYGSFNQLGARGMMDPAGLEVTDSQLIIADRSRLLFWNNPSQLTNNYPPADGVVGQPNFTTRPRWDPMYGRLRADTHGRLWAVKGGNGTPTQILAYALPLTTGAQPTIQISSPIHLRGGGDFSWSADSLVLAGIAYQADCDCLWLSDTGYNRVFRISYVSSPQREVDIVLGQKRDVVTSEIGTHCNQGRDSDDGYIHPALPSQDSLCHPGGLALDNYGNLFVSDHNLEVAGNWRLLEYDAASLPTSPATALFAVPASRVYGRNGSFTSPNCVSGDPLCGSWEPVFGSNNQMIIGFNGYLGPKFPQIYHDPLVNALPYGSLMDFFSHAYSMRLDPLKNLYVLDLTRNRVLIYRSAETLPPTVLSIQRANTNPVPPEMASVDFTVAFSETVTGVTTDDFALATTGVTGAAVTGVSGADSTYTVTVNAGLGNGTIRLDVVDNNTIIDAASNPLGGTGGSDGDFTSGETYMVIKGFNSINRWTTAFDSSHGWTVADHVRTVGDVNGDGKDDLVGFGLDGVYVALSNGGGFGAISKWTSAFDLSHGWTVKDYVRTVGDINGDGKADLVGFGLDGVYVALSNGSAFGSISKWTSAFDLSHGWTVKDYVRTVGDVNGDGKADLVGFGLDGVYVALSNGSTFATVSKWTSAFDLSHGWTVKDYVRTVGDINGDGKDDLVGFGLDGVYVALSSGDVFGAVSKWTSAFDRAHGWTVSQFTRTVGDMNGDGKTDLIGFGLDGVYIALSTGSGFTPVSRWTSSFDLSHGWTVSEYVRTVGDVSGDGVADLIGFGLDGVYIAK